ncbi:hypothetical protein ACFLY2_01770 [Patescibacteria group bacterium]
MGKNMMTQKVVNKSAKAISENLSYDDLRIYIEKVYNFVKEYNFIDIYKYILLGESKKSYA